MCKLKEKAYVDSATIDQAIQLQEDVVPEDPWKKILFFFGEKILSRE